MLNTGSQWPPNYSVNLTLTDAKEVILTKRVICASLRVDYTDSLGK